MNDADSSTQIDTTLPELKLDKMRSHESPSPPEDEQEQFFNENQRSFRENHKSRRMNVNTQAITNPIQKSVEFLTAILDFWLDPKNKALLYKQEHKKVIGKELEGQRKNDLYQNVWKLYIDFS